MRKLLVAAACVLVLASVALAQTQMETKWHCPKATAAEKYDVGDPGGHAYAIEQGTCNSTTSNAGEKSGAFTESLEWAKTSFATHGRMIVTMENGDQTYYAYDGTGDMARKSAAIKWKIAGGTGKHKTTKATGSCTGSFNDDGTSDFVCTGTIAPAAAAAANK
jgi:hypothetical protein